MASAAHFDQFGNAGFTLRWVGCIVCATQEGMGWACCQRIFCETHYHEHVREPLDA